MAGSTFQTNPIDLDKLLDDCHSGVIQLPDFQRSWVWDEERIKGLIASVSRAFPIGALMSLNTGGPVNFKPRPVEGAPLFAKEVTPRSLLLDGQQRMTSLYQVTVRGKVVETVTPKNKKVKRWFYIDIRKALDPSVEREEAIIGIPFVEPGGLLGDVFALVVHGDGDIDDAFFEPGAPVLKHAPVGFAVAPGGFCGRAAAEGDEGGGDGEIGPDGERVQIDAADHVCDLVATPLGPGGVRGSGGRGVVGDVVRLLEPPDADGVVADVDAGGGRLGGAAGEVGIADAVEVETVDGVVTDEVGDDFDGVGGGIRVAEIEPEFGAEAVALEGDAGGGVWE